MFKKFLAVFALLCVLSSLFAATASAMPSGIVATDYYDDYYGYGEEAYVEGSSDTMIFSVFLSVIIFAGTALFVLLIILLILAIPISLIVIVILLIVMIAKKKR